MELTDPVSLADYVRLIALLIVLCLKASGQNRDMPVSLSPLPHSPLSVSVSVCLSVCLSLTLSLSLSLSSDA